MSSYGSFRRRGTSFFIFTSSFTKHAILRKENVYDVVSSAEASPPLIASAFASKSITTPSKATHFAAVAYHSVSSFPISRAAAVCCNERSVLMCSISARTAAKRVSYLRVRGGKMVSREAERWRASGARAAPRDHSQCRFDARIG